MYNPIQILYILNLEENRNIDYREEKDDDFNNTIICFGQIEAKGVANNIIIPDGCIDLVIDYDSKQIGLSGMAKTDFNFKVKSNNLYLGARFFPGTIYKLFEMSCEKIMDNYINIQNIDNNFDIERFFSLSIEESYRYIKYYIKMKQNEHEDFYYKDLFLDLYKNNEIMSVKELASKLNISSRQLQRVFLREYGLTPSMTLSVIRFQKSLKHLIENIDKISLVESSFYYYDQAHFNKDIRKNIGITPLNLIKKYLKN